MVRLTPAVCIALLGLGACSGPERDSVPLFGEDHEDYKLGEPYVVDGVLYVPRIEPDYDEVGYASWYGPGFHGLSTANGEIYDMDALTAAHPTLPLPSRVHVVNLENRKSVVLTVNDRGPFLKGRIIDVSRRAARELGFFVQGTARVRVRVLDSPAFGQSAHAGSFYVQAGAFATQRSAYRLRARLQPVGSFDVASMQASGTILHRVRSGPLSTRDEAVDLLIALHRAGHAGARMVRN